MPHRLPILFLLGPLLLGVGVTSAVGAEGSGSDEGSAPKTEWAIFPEVSYDSDVGLGVGILADLARLEPGFDPWRVKVTAQAFLTIGRLPDGSLTIPYTNNYVNFDFAGLAAGRLRVRGRVFLRRQTNSGWYGPGNRSVVLEDAAARYHEYDHLYPGARVDGWVRLGGGFSAVVGGRLVWNWIETYEGSLLEADAPGLVGARRHGLAQVQGGLLLDTRDDETAPERGFFGEATLRGGAVLEDWNGYGGLNTTLRIYAPLVPGWLSLATRGMADVLVGDPPFYELGRFAGTRPEEFWGAVGVRGIRQRRYAGKVRFMGNLELRARLLRFGFLKRPAVVGALGFVDAGRVFAGVTPHPELDGADLGLHVAAGFGLRIRWGESLMIRADFAWSEDGCGIYADVNHIF